jgi:hypothetical protein
MMGHATGLLGTSEVPAYSVCSARTRYTVARLTPKVFAMMLADSRPACIRRASAASELSSAFGCPMCCPGPDAPHAPLHDARGQAQELPTDNENEEE